MNKPTTPEYVSNCHGAYITGIYPILKDGYSLGKRKEVCSKCHESCTPVESGGSREKGESDET